MAAKRKKKEKKKRLHKARAGDNVAGIHIPHNSPLNSFLLGLGHTQIQYSLGSLRVPGTKEFGTGPCNFHHRAKSYTDYLMTCTVDEIVWGGVTDNLYEKQTSPSQKKHPFWIIFSQLTQWLKTLLKHINNYHWCLARSTDETQVRRPCVGTQSWPGTPVHPVSLHDTLREEENPTVTISKMSPPPWHLRDENSMENTMSAMLPTLWT